MYVYVNIYGRLNFSTSPIAQKEMKSDAYLLKIDSFDK